MGCSHNQTQRFCDMKKILAAAILVLLLSSCGASSAPGDSDQPDIATPPAVSSAAGSGDTAPQVPFNCFHANPTSYSFEDTGAQSREQVTERMFELILKGMMEPDAARTFTLTEYRNPAIEIYTKTDLTAMNAAENPLASLAGKLTDDQWIALCAVEFRYKGEYGAVGNSKNLPDDVWASDWFGMYGVLFERTGNVYHARAYPA